MVMEEEGRRIKGEAEGEWWVLGRVGSLKVGQSAATSRQMGEMDDQEAWPAGEARRARF